MRKLAVLILGSLCGLLVTCKKPDLPLRVRVAGCQLLWDQTSRLVCAAKFPEELRLILSIDGRPLARLRFRIGDTIHGETTFPSSGHVTINEPFPKVASQVTLRAESAEGGAEYTLEVLPTIPFPKAYALCDTLHCGPSESAKQCLESAQRILARLDADPRELDASEQAFLLGMVGKRLGEAAQREARTHESETLRQLALSVLERTMAEARASGLLSVEAWALERLGRAMLGQRGEYDLHLAATKLSDPVHRRALDQCPEPLGNVNYWLSRLDLDQGNLTAAKLLASEAAAITEEFALVRHHQIATRLQEALAAQSLQETQEAERLVSQVEKQLAGGFLDNPCEITKQYNSLAWIRLVARQSGHVASDPEASFGQVAAFLPRCEKQSKVADEERGVLSTNRALYALQRAEEAASGSSERLRQLALADSMSQQAREDQAKGGRLEQMVVQQDLAYLTARIALLRGQVQDALRAFELLEKLTTKWLAPHYRAASQVGQADAHLLLGETEEARTGYARAEALLDRMTAELPTMKPRQLFLTQFEAGTGRYLKLLLAEPGMEDKVLDVIRHARVRALHTYARGPGTGGGHSETDELMARYWTLLGEREETQAKLRAAPLAEMAAFQRDLERLKNEQAGLIEELYTGDAAASGQLELRPPAPGELLIACYPLPAEPGEPPPPWVCAGAIAGRTEILRIAAPKDAAPVQAAQAILTGFGPALRQAKHLRILYYGPLRNVAWASLPWAGGRLEERLTISYGVDSPAPSVSIARAGNHALLVTNPQQDLLGAQRAGERLRKELPAAGWQLDVRTGAPRRGGHLLTLLRKPLHWWQPPPALAKDVVANLPGSELFVYYGHAESLGPGGWDSRLLFAEEGSLSARDVMSLPMVPRKVLLIGCETAVSAREAPADEGGLAQAFVLRGSEEVVATTRKVADATAEALVEELTQLGALRPDGPPLAASLRDAIAALRPLHPAVELDSFRVYTP